MVSAVQEFRLKSENQFRRQSAPLMVVRVRTCVDWDQIWEWELQFGTEERGEGQWVYGDAGIAWPRPQSPAPEPESGNLRPEPEPRHPGPGTSDKVNRALHERCHNVTTSSSFVFKSWKERMWTSCLKCIPWYKVIKPPEALWDRKVSEFSQWKDRSDSQVTNHRTSLVAVIA